MKKPPGTAPARLAQIMTRVVHGDCFDPDTSSGSIIVRVQQGQARVPPCPFVEYARDPDIFRTEGQRGKGRRAHSAASQRVSPAIRLPSGEPGPPGLATGYSTAVPISTAPVR